MFFWQFSKKRKYQRQESIGNILLKRGLTLLLLTFLNSISMISFEGLSAKDSIWLTLTTITTTGYGDFFPKTDLGRLAMVGFIYVGGITTFAAFFGDVADFRRNRRDMVRQGKWNFNMKKHILIIGLTKIGRNRYLNHLVAELRDHAEYTDTNFLFLAPDLDESTLTPQMRDDGFSFNVGSGSRIADLKLANAAQAMAIMVLCSDPQDPSADDVTAAVVHRLRSDMGLTAPIVAEAANDENRAFIRSNGASAVTRATNDYPGIMVKALAVPGSELILEDFFQKEGADICDVPHTGTNGEPWNICAMRLLQSGITLVGYVDNANKVHRLGTPTIANARHLIVLRPPVTGNQQAAL